MKILANDSCIKLKQISLSNNDILDQHTQEKILQIYYGNCLDQVLIKDILSTISQFYMDKGYITTKPYLKEQDILDGQLDIEILEGKVESIIHDETNSSSSKIATAFIFQEGEVLNLRDLETSLEMVNRVSSSDAKFEIEPGTKQGDSVVRIKTQSSFPLHLQLGVSGSRSLNDKNPNLSGVLTFDNPLNLNDILKFTYNGSRIQKQYQSTTGKEINYSFPLGSYLLEFIQSYSSYNQGVYGINDLYLAQGDTVGSQIQISKVLTRDQSNKFELKGSIYHKDTQNYFANQLIEVLSYKTTLANLDLIHTYLQPWGQVATTYSYFQGKDWFGARDDGYSSLESDYETDAKLEFKKYTLGSTLIYYFSDNTYQLNSTFHLQYSKNYLYNNDQISIGSDYTVRGYGDSSLVGNNGFYLHNDLIKSFEIGLDDTFLKTISPYIGFDYGKIRCQKDNSETCGTLYGAAIGVKTAADTLSTNFMWSRGLKKLSSSYEKDTYFRFDITFNF